jgi:hypothetical protein
MWLRIVIGILNDRPFVDQHQAAFFVGLVRKPASGAFAAGFFDIVANLEIGFDEHFENMPPPSLL